MSLAVHNRTHRTKINKYLFSQRATKDVYSCMKKGRLSFFTEQSSMHKKTRKKSNTQNSTKTQRQQTFRIHFFVCFSFVIWETAKYIYTCMLKYYKKWHGWKSVTPKFCFVCKPNVLNWLNRLTAINVLTWLSDQVVTLWTDCDARSPAFDSRRWHFSVL